MPQPRTESSSTESRSTESKQYARERMMTPIGEGPGPGAEDPQAALEPPFELRQLEPFIGRWKTEGRNHPAAPSAPNAEVVGEMSFEWMPGRFFVMGRWDRTIGRMWHRGINMIGYEEAEGAFFSQHFDNFGYPRTYRLEELDGIWRFTGEWERSRLVFGADNQSFEETWELTKDGTIWQPVCEMRSVKLD